MRTNWGLILYILVLALTTSCNDDEQAQRGKVHKWDVVSLAIYDNHALENYHVCNISDAYFDFDKDMLYLYSEEEDLQYTFTLEFSPDGRLISVSSPPYKTYLEITTANYEIIHYDGYVRYWLSLHFVKDIDKLGSPERKYMSLGLNMAFYK
ncbi:hypothetical protein LJC43_04600 [Parabacteroides sp. OttesenSCG-928-G21]|nr:hypothetical protein [Parabacteroides sp. OttesenSCG-928-G21]